MKNETKAKLIAAGRTDLIEAHEIIQSGYGGIDNFGTIVDRRRNPKATPFSDNRALNAPPSKAVKEDFFPFCEMCRERMSPILWNCKTIGYCCEQCNDAWDNEPTESKI